MRILNTAAAIPILYEWAYKPLVKPDALSPQATLSTSFGMLTADHRTPELTIDARSIPEGSSADNVNDNLPGHVFDGSLYWQGLTGEERQMLLEYVRQGILDDQKRERANRDKAYLAFGGLAAMYGLSNLSKRFVDKVLEVLKERRRARAAEKARGSDDSSPKPTSLKARLEALQSASSSSSNNDSQRSRVPSGSLKDRIAMFNANADTAKPLIPTAAFGTSAPPPGSSRNVSGGGLIGNRLPKLDPSGAGVIGRNVAQPVGRKVSESRGLVGNRIPGVVKHHTGGSTGSVGSSGRVEKEQHEGGGGSVPPPLEAADLEEDAVDLSASTATVAEPKPTTDSSNVTSSTTRSDIPQIRAEGLVPSTLPHDEDAGIDSDASQPPSPRSTAATASETSPSLTAMSEASGPALNRVISSLSVGSVGTQKSSASRVTQASSLRVETGADEDGDGDGQNTDGADDDGRQNEGERKRHEEDQDNLSDVSTPTGTPTMPAREFLPEIPGTASSSIGGLSLHTDGHVSVGAFGTAKGMPSLGQHDDDITVDTSAIPDEQEKLKHEQKIVEENPNATETEKNRKGTEAESQGDFTVTDDKMVHIELAQDDPALTEEGRELQRLGKEKLAKAATEQGKSEWQVMNDDSENRPEQVKREQASANEKETGDPNKSFASVHEAQRKEAEEKAEKQGEEGQDTGEAKLDKATIPSKDFGAGDVTEPPTAQSPPTKATIFSNGDKGDEPESPLSNDTREHTCIQGDTEDSKDVTAETSEDAEGMQTPTEVVEPPTPAPDARESEEATEEDAETIEEEVTVSDVTDIVDVQDIEDIPTGDDTEMHRKDQDPNVESLVVGKSDDTGVEPKVEITEDDIVEEPAATVAVEATTQPAVTSDVEEPASASFPSVPQQEPQSTTSNRSSAEISRTPTPGPDGLNLPSVPKDDVEQEDSPQGKVRVGVTLSPGKHLGSSRAQTVESRGTELNDDAKRFEAKKDGPGASDVQTKNTATSIDAMATTLADPTETTRLAKSTSSSSTLSSSSSSSAKRKKAQGGRSPFLDMDPDGEDGGETGWAKVSVNKTKYS